MRQMAEEHIKAKKQKFIVELIEKWLAEVETAKMRVKKAMNGLADAENNLEAVSKVTEKDLVMLNDCGRLYVTFKEDFEAFYDKGGGAVKDLRPMDYPGKITRISEPSQSSSS